MRCCKITGREFATVDISVEVLLTMGCSLLIEECISWDVVSIFLLVQSLSHLKDEGLKAYHILSEIHRLNSPLILSRLSKCALISLSFTTALNNLATLDAL